jgi:hypothetical protein
MILEGLYRAVAARSARHGVPGGPLAGSFILLVCRRIRTAERLVLKLLAQYQAGRLYSRVFAPRPAPPAPRAAPELGLPVRFGWLLPMVPTAAAGFASQLRHWLAEPEVQALLAASAQARRVLAPICRMLAIEAAMLQSEPASRAKPEPAMDDAGSAAIATRRKRSGTVEWGRIALPRGVLAAARRQGFAKG